MNYFIECSEIAEVGHSSKDFGNQLFASIAFPPPNTAQWEEQVYGTAFASVYPSVHFLMNTSQFVSSCNKWSASICACTQIRRLYLLLTVKESAIDVPTNLEARRRITFFSNSLFMNMPRAPRVRKMLSFRLVAWSSVCALKYIYTLAIYLCVCIVLRAIWLQLLMCYFISQNI